MNQGILSVSDFLESVNQALAFGYPAVTIEAEVSGYKVNQGKFVFFDLKDARSSVGCFMMLFALRVPLEDGMKVRVVASPKLTTWGKFSLTVRSVEPAGEGALRRAQELLRQKLAGEGLFDAGRKRALPRYPRAIGLVTSGTSAAYADFIKILGARWGGVTVRLADVTVQGASAPDQIVGALEYFNQAAEPVDVVVLIRGGGSLEDLSAFSTEPVARAVAVSRQPIIVGVGHEIDTSLADLAADVRAATPTDAARLVVPDRTEALAGVAQARLRLDSGLARLLDQQLLQLDRAITRLERFLGRPRAALEDNRRRLWRGFERTRSELRHAGSETLRARRAVISRLTAEIQTARGAVAARERLIRANGPEATLGRGYAIVTADGAPVTAARDVGSGTRLMIKLRQGHLTAETLTDGNDQTG